MAKPPKAQTTRPHVFGSAPSWPGAANAQAWDELGVQALEAGQLAQALDLFDRASLADPSAPGPAFHHGMALLMARRPDEAAARFEALVARHPQLLPAHFQRGRALLAAGRPTPALASFDHVLAAAGDAATPPELHLARGLALFELQRLDDALAALDRALQQDERLVDAWTNRGNVLRALGRRDEALAAHDRAAALTPEEAGVAFNRGNVLLELKRYDEAAAAYARALALDPSYPFAAGKRLHAQAMACDWRHWDEHVADVRRGLVAGQPVVDPFAWAGVATSPQELRRCAELMATQQFPERARVTPRAGADDGPPRDGRLRIGYLCGEFRHQATTILAIGLWEAHDRGRVALVAFDSGWDDGSTLRRRVEAAFDEVVPIAHLDDDAAARAVADRGIDILVNLNGWFGLARTGVFARRPAPVQVNWLGFPGTVGAPYLDVLVADAQVIPPGEEGAYTERVVRLPRSYQPNDPRRAIDASPTSRADWGLPDDAVVFCCFNNTYKILPATFAAWMRLLQAVPGAVLWLLHDTDVAVGNLRAAATAAGVDPARLVFAPRIRPDRHLARHACADLFLDTLPYNAHTTASDALWAGLPVLSCRGSTFAGRVGASLLQAVGLADELLVEDMDAYEARALALARDPARRARLREALRAGRGTAPLWDAAGFARDLEAAFLQMRAGAAR